MTERKELIGEYYKSLMKFKTLFEDKKDNVCQKYDIQKAHMRLLYNISVSDKVTTSSLAKELGITDSAVTQLIDSLFNLNYVERIHSGEDRRIIYLKLSAFGIEQFEKIKIDHINHLEILFEQLSDEELLTLTKIQNKLTS